MSLAEQMEGERGQGAKNCSRVGDWLRAWIESKASLRNGFQACFGQGTNQIMSSDLLVKMSH